MEEKEIWLPTVEQLEEALMRERRRKKHRRALWITLCSLLVVMAAAVFLSMYLLPVLQISGESMSPTLEDREFVVAVSDHTYRTGEVIAFQFNNSILVKRVIAYAGDWVDIDNGGNVYVNGALLEEPYLEEKVPGECNIVLPYQVPEGKCFVMGDNRLTSVDSRNSTVGCIDDDAVVGRLLWRVWPLNVFGPVK